MRAKMRAAAVLTTLRDHLGHGQTRDALVSKAIKRSRTSQIGQVISDGAVGYHSFGPRAPRCIPVQQCPRLPMQQYRCLSAARNNKQASSTSSSAVSTTKRKKKRQNVKRPAALTKRDKLLTPATTTKTETDYPGAFAVAIKERLAPTVQTNVDSIKDYAASLFQSDHPRAKRTGPKMDGKWWSVNIILALTPAALLALYCESQRGPMEEYFKSTRERERRKIMGEFGVEEDEADDALSKLDIGEKEFKKSFSDRVGDAASTLYAFASTYWSEECEANDVEDAATLQEDNNNDNVVSPEHAVEEAKDAKATADATTAAPDAMNPSSDPSIEALTRRIEALEKQLEAKIKIEDRDRRMREHQLQYQLKRAGQSGVQNRVEDRWIDEWRKEEAEGKRKNEQVRKGEDADKPEFSILRIMKHNAKEKGRIWLEYGSAAVDAIKGAMEDSSTEKLNEEDGHKVTGNENSEPASKAQAGDSRIASVVSAVEQTSNAVQQSARATQESVDALGNGNDNLAAAERAAEASKEAKKAAHSALAAANAASDIAPPAVDTASNQQALRRATGWVRSRIFGPKEGDNDGGKST